MVNSPGEPRRRIGAIQVAEAMHYLHSKAPPLVHRDLKCANILIDESCTPQPAAHPSKHPERGDNLVPLPPPLPWVPTGRAGSPCGLTSAAGGARQCRPLSESVRRAHSTEPLWEGVRTRQVQGMRRSATSASRTPRAHRVGTSLTRTVQRFPTLIKPLGRLKPKTLNPETPRTRRKSLRPQPLDRSLA